MPDAAAAAAAAERQRRHRERRRRGICVVPVELSEDHINVLTATGWLAPEDAADTHACGGAVRRILDALTKFPSRLKSAKRTKPV